MTEYQTSIVNDHLSCDENVTGCNVNAGPVTRTITKYIL